MGLTAAIIAAALALSPQAELGEKLFFEAELSGNRNISCADCHHPDLATGDGLALPIGEGGEGIGPTRTTGAGPDAIVERVPRNSPPLFGLALASRLFWDGRIEHDDDMPSGIASPAGDDLPEGLDSLLAAQAMFPVTSPTEMAGGEQENPIGELAAHGDLPGIWAALAERLRELPYVEEFLVVYPELMDAEGITYVHAANAIAAFEEQAFPVPADAPYARFLAGDRHALSPAQRRGLHVFEDSCAGCHSGPLLSDMKHHAIAMPQLGPGKDADHRDVGRELVTGRHRDRYAFRTPPLWNVARTGPYGHAGAFETLTEVVLHHVRPTYSLMEYECAPPVPLRADLHEADCAAMDGLLARSEILRANDMHGARVSPLSTGDLVAFLHALSAPAVVHE